MTLTLKEILIVNLNLMMYDVYVYAPFIYHNLFYLSLCDQECELDDLEVNLDDDLEIDLDSDLECLYDLLCDFFFTIFESDFFEWHWTDLDLEADLEELRDFFLGDFFTIFDLEERRDFFLGDFTIFESDFLELRRPVELN